MALVKWSDWFALGIPELDHQHQTLFEALNQLHDAILEGQEQARVAQTLDFLLDYTARHFRDEEAFMAGTGFTGLAGHRAEHAQLLARTGEFRERYQADPGGSQANDLANFLLDWITQHILDADRQYAEAVKAGQGSPPAR